MLPICRRFNFVTILELEQGQAKILHGWLELASGTHGLHQMRCPQCRRQFKKILDGVYFCPRCKETWKKPN